jgi:hypothetical protein
MSHFMGHVTAEPLSLVDKLLMCLPCFASHVIRSADGSPYLLRKYLLPKRFSGAWWPGVFLHKFYRSDEDRFPHNHPWRFAVSLILTGGYIERRYKPDGQCIELSKHVRRPLTFNVIRAEDFHKAQLLEPKRGCWTLFVAWRHKTAKPGEEWGFWDIDHGCFVGWREYLPPGADGLEGD